MDGVGPTNRRVSEPNPRPREILLRLRENSLVNRVRSRSRSRSNHVLLLVLVLALQFTSLHSVSLHVDVLCLNGNTLSRFTNESVMYASLKTHFTSAEGAEVFASPTRSTSAGGVWEMPYMHDPLLGVLRHAPPL